MKRKFTSRTLSRRKTQGISTAALPDIVFILLFFFMMATVVKKDDHEQWIEVNYPTSNLSESLQNLSFPLRIYIGKPKSSTEKSWKVVLNDTALSMEQLESVLENELRKLPETQKESLIIELGIDKDVPVSIVFQVRELLQKLGIHQLIYFVQPQSEKK